MKVNKTSAFTECGMYLFIVMMLKHMFCTDSNWWSEIQPVSMYKVRVLNA